METSQIIIVTVAAVVVCGLVGFVIYNAKRRQHLRDHFGPEYERTVAELGDQRRAESELSRREERIRTLPIRPLSVSDRQKFIEQWRVCQARFVDDPVGAVDEADGLVTDVMRARGYAAAKLHDRLADISAAYPKHAEHYRMAEAIAMRHRLGQASTEDLRNGFVHYRALFDEMLGGPGGNDEQFRRVS